MSASSWGLFVWDIKPKRPRPMSPAWLEANKDKLTVSEMPPGYPDPDRIGTRPREYAPIGIDNDPYNYALQVTRTGFSSLDSRHESFGSR